MPEVGWSNLRRRLVSGVVGVSAAAVLGAAVWLEPELKGHSTHLQLGLSPCTFYSLSGYPCPMCGMTTTFAWMAEGSVLRAVATQPFGVVLFMLTLASFVTSAFEFLSPRGRWESLLGLAERYELKLAIFFLIGLCAGWMYKIVTMV